MEKLPIEDAYSADLLKAIGIFFATAADVKNALATQLVRLTAHPTKPDMYSIFPFVGMDTKVKLKIIKDLCYFKFPDESEKIYKLCDKIRRSYDHRNALAHMSHAPESKDKLGLYTLKLQGDGLMQQPKKVTTKDIRNHAATMLKRGLALEQLLVSSGLMPQEELRELLASPTKD